jgi:hypothetical protein
MVPLRLRPTAGRLALAALLSSLLAGSAAAQQPTQAQADAIRQSCRSDYQAHCASVPTGGSAALQCLKQNLPSLSPGCQSAVNATQGGAAPSPPAAASSTAAAPPPPPPPAMSLREEAVLMRNACGIDFRTFCRGVPLGGGRALACLADHNESLTPPCRNALAAARGR